MAPLHYAAATELAERINTGDLSPVTVVQVHLDRIAARNDELTAYPPS